ncbi:MAG: methyl-accepting chemotaxis protein, partial [Rhodocyclaceae bacterium]|nr:methyl-accepting chemotaxis protein [Rhodocyclaceae bacterium]
PGSLAARLATASGFMIFAALLIQQSRGLVEAHFGVFVLLAFLLYYRDWRPIAAAAGVIAVHHLAFNFMQGAGLGVFVLANGANLYMILMHAAYVVFEAGVLIYMATKLRAQALESARIADISERIGDGDLSPLPADARGSGMPLLAKVVDMHGNLRQTLQSVHSSTDAVLGKAGELDNNARSLDAAMDGQRNATASIATTIEEQTATIHHLSENASHTRKLAEDSRKAATEGAQVVRATVAEIQNTATAIGSLQGEMDKLGRQFDSVSAAVNLITEIADQTNLLALNAAIEAARAGEQGRGFAVVADEVRGLAERTTQATKEISRTMLEMRTSKDSAMSGIQVTVGRAAQGVDLARKAGDSIDSIGQGADLLQERVARIAQALDEQSRAAEQIAHNIEGIAQMTHSASAIS